MLRTEVYETIGDMTLVRTWSDDGMMIRQDGTEHLYEEAVDPDFVGRTYTETDIPIGKSTDTPTEEWPDPEGGEIPEEVGVPEEEPTEPEEGGTGSTIPIKPSKKY